MGAQAPGLASPLRSIQKSSSQSSCVCSKMSESASNRIEAAIQQQYPSHSSISSPHQAAVLANHQAEVHVGMVSSPQAVRQPALMPPLMSSIRCLVSLLQTPSRQGR